MEPAVAQRADLAARTRLGDEAAGRLAEGHATEIVRCPSGVEGATVAEYLIAVRVGEARGIECDVTEIEGIHRIVVHIERLPFAEEGIGVHEEAEGLSLGCIHVGDIDRRGDDVSGLGVVVAARAMAVADVGQIVVTASVPAAVIGQTAIFEPAGTHQLKGIPGTWELYQLAS